MEGGGQAGDGRNEVDGMLEGVDRRTEEGDWQTGGCRSWTEVTGGRAGNRPSIIAGGGKKLAFECYSFFCANQFSCSIQLKDQGGDQPHMANNGVGVGGRLDYLCFRISQPLTIWGLLSCSMTAMLQTGEAERSRTCEAASSADGVG